MAATHTEDCLAIRARDVVRYGPTLQAEATALTEDVNEAYLMVHRTVARAMTEPVCGPVSGDELSRELTDRLAGPAARRHAGSA